MSQPDPTTAPPAPDADELAALRKEKAEREAAEKEREAAERKAEQDELAALRKEKAEHDERERKQVKPPTPRKDREPADDDTPPAPKKRKRNLPSSYWGDQDED